MHLSRLFPGERHRHAVRDLSSPYALHQTLRWAFPGAGQPEAALPTGERLLWRQDTLTDPDSGEPGPVLLVQSVTPPDWGALNARDPGYLRAWNVRTLDLAPVLTPGQPLRFRLHANVTVRRQDEQGRSARHGLHRPEDQLAWLDRQGEKNGFDLLGADIRRAGRVRTRKGAQVITLHTVTFEGALRVRQPDLFHAAVRGGLGHAKSLGCGLLSLAPL
ncbi:type I-E CRISPR-associated protein Cas6/Cse3/CasE [Deinococcus metallilatus]|uniref:Type I-E CRISPR-associated protein Cas6/Cse3/CasE n=1 Tax=Deinococcus metallilatus TaxID=1211322 RepID=A0AAJ5F4B9_9DEIO|nr:type I-E CRISPR-associated protein Cas6/Cse3/CasE [Deinococcus metallilatus]RXJ09558.1 type I-E CRISPR-associated protein Cas6/Cse3/CasE [Deinococcus metallilatus]TLK29079.1 type I-E CRISPR-associated protein Cas6/Cse3/CasE [Deinococcus metallilatus]